MSSFIKEYKWPLLLIAIGVIVLAAVVSVELLSYTQTKTKELDDAAKNTRVAMLGALSTFFGFIQFTVQNYFKRYTVQQKQENNLTRNVIEDRLKEVPSDLEKFTVAVISLGEKIDKQDEASNKKHGENKLLYEQLKELIEGDRTANIQAHQEHRTRLDKLEFTQDGIIKSLDKIKAKLDCE